MFIREATIILSKILDRTIISSQGPTIIEMVEVAKRVAKPPST